MTIDSCYSFTLFLSFPIFLYLNSLISIEDKKVTEEHDGLQTKIEKLEVSLNKIN